MTAEADAVKTVAGLMVLAARTAPKAVGQDSVVCRVVTGKEQEKLAARIEAMGKALGMGFFFVNAGQVRKSDATLLIGVEGTKALGLNCGGCGFSTCVNMIKAGEGAAKRKKSVYSGPNCVFKVSDLGIAVGSAVKTASIHNVDNRIMFTAGVAALELGMLKGCSVAYGIPLKAAGKNPYFDVVIKH
ncbi:MAG: DUF2148 domain-containing protein [Methanoregula sp.]|nr:MAG: DUF2148 domain-containing protein [Methanoregula sp.]